MKNEQQTMNNDRPKISLAHSSFFPAAAFDQRERDAFLHDLAVLVDDPAAQVMTPRRPRPRSSFASTLRRTRIVSPMKTGSRKCHSLTSGTPCVRIGGAFTPRPLPIDEDEQAVGDRPAERRRLGELVVDVDRVEVAARGRRS